MSINYLDLDKIVPPTRKIQWKGVEYSVKTITVEEFIELNESTKKEDLEKQLTPVESVNFLVDQILNSVPEFPREELVKMDFDRLSLIIDFLKGVHEEQIQESGGEKKL